jgi:hypothetical protein
MIHYHGTPITPESVALRVLPGRHAFVSFYEPRNADLAAKLCQSFALDNGAFSAWRANKPVEDWRPYYEWAADLLRLPSCDWAVIPDVIDGTEGENDALLREWPHGHQGVPVWHLNESVDRLVRLADDWPRVALGSTQEYDVSSPRACLGRLGEVLPAICDEDGIPIVKLHGLRMLREEIVTRVPLASADSTNIGQNIGIDQAWHGTYRPATKETRAQVLAERIEQHQSPAGIDRLPEHQPSIFDMATT